MGKYFDVLGFDIKAFLGTGIRVYKIGDTHYHNMELLGGYLNGLCRFYFCILFLPIFPLALGAFIRTNLYGGERIARLKSPDDINHSVENVSVYYNKKKQRRIYDGKKFAIATLLKKRWFMAFLFWAIGAAAGYLSTGTLNLPTYLNILAGILAGGLFNLLYIGFVARFSRLY